MGLVRGRRRLGGLLALAALALQMTLAFGHVHAESFAAAAPGFSTIQAAETADRGGGDSPRQGGHDACAICATVHLAGALLLPATPAIAALPNLARARPEAPAPHVRTAAIALPFQARAPPQA